MLFENEMLLNAQFVKVMDNMKIKKSSSTSGELLCTCCAKRHLKEPLKAALLLRRYDAPAESCRRSPELLTLAGESDPLMADVFALLITDSQVRAWCPVVATSSESNLRRLVGGEAGSERLDTTPGRCLIHCF